MARCHGSTLMTSLALLTLARANPDAKRLYDDLIMKGYNKHCRPVRSYENATLVALGLSLSQIVNVDEINQIMTINLWVEQHWHDVRFIWETKQYNNITMLHVPIEKIWRPDIVLYNNADGDYTVTTVSKATITPNGQVTWKPPMQFKSFCSIDVEYFPFDEQNCSMKFGPWTHDASQVDITHRKQSTSVILSNTTIGHALGMDQYQRGVEWDVMEALAQKNLIKYPCCPEVFSDVTFHVALKRRTLYYIYNLIIPLLSIMLLTCLSFYLPSHSGEKISITISVFLSLSVFQLLLMDLVPSTSLKLPLIGKHIMATLCLSTISILFNTFILCMNYRSTATHEMSDRTRWLFLVVLPKILHMKNPMIPEEKQPKRIDRDYQDINGICQDGGLHGRAYENEYGVRRRSSMLPFHRIPAFDKTTFIGLDKNKLNFKELCDACVIINMRRFQPTIQKGLESGWFLAQHYSDEDDSARVKDEWRFVAQVLDRILLWIFLVISVMTALVVCLNAPALYDNRTPLATTVPNTTADILRLRH